MIVSLQEMHDGQEPIVIVSLQEMHDSHQDVQMQSKLHCGYVCSLQDMQLTWSQCTLEVMVGSYASSLASCSYAC